MIIPVRFSTTRAADAVRFTVHFDEYDEMPEDFPGREDFPKPNRRRDLGAITLTIDLDTATIRDWPAGRTADLHLKPVDSGKYELLDGETVIATREDYVPGCVPGAHGDYVVMKIDEAGAIYSEDGRRWAPRADTIAADFGLDDEER